MCALLCFIVSNSYENALPFQASNSNLPKHIPALITDSLRACDPELRQVLMGNVILTGGGSQFSGFADRLNNELTRSFPHVRVIKLCLSTFASNIVFRSKSPPPVILLNEDTVLGLVVVF